MHLVGSYTYYHKYSTKAPKRLHNYHHNHYHVVLCGFETISHIKGRIYTCVEDKGLKNMSGPNREKTVGDWRKLPNEELQNMHSSSDTIRVGTYLLHGAQSFLRS